MAAYQNTSRGFAIDMRHQEGVALISLTVLLVLVGTYYFVNRFNNAQPDLVRSTAVDTRLASAKEALIGDAIAVDFNGSAILSNPDIGVHLGNNVEGYESGNFLGNATDFTVAGKYPWKTLKTPPFRDSHSECFWLIVSGRFKKTPLSNAPRNWDTPGQIDVIDSYGNPMATSLAALIIAPGPPLDAQNRKMDDPAYRECGGNYDARNYLDSFDPGDAIAGEVNYFAGSINNRVASNASNKRFVLAKTPHFNDRLLFVTVDDVFKPLIRRSDFVQSINDLMNTIAASNPVPSANKGTDNYTCSNTDAFCKNWKEMLFLAQLPVASPITIDGTQTANCSKVLIFSGQRTGLQRRATAAEKADKNNYLEAPNVVSFSAPIAFGVDFSGAGTFDWRRPTTDILKCIP